MTDTYWQWMAALVLAVAIAFILAFPKLRRVRPTPEPDVATEAAREPLRACPDLHDQVDMIVDSVEQEEYERLYGRLRWHVDVAMQRGKEQLL